MLLRVIQERLASEKQRETECPMRSEGRCKLINEMMGWDHGTPLPDCNTCWSLGGPPQAEAEKWRADYAKRMILYFAEPQNLASLPTTARNAIASHVDGGQSLLVEPPPEEESFIGKATHFGKSMASRWPGNRKVSLPIKEVRHIGCFGADIAGNRLQEPCPSLSRLEGGHFCADCGCGSGKMARLDVVPDEYGKLDYPYLWCPRGRPGFSYDGKEQ